MNWTLLQNSLVVSALATGLALVFGFMAALWLAGLAARWRNGFLVMAIMTLALPPFLVTNCWLELLGHAGVWRRWLPWEIYSLPGTVWILALLWWPITLLFVLGAWQRLEPSQLESEPALHSTALIRWLLWPQARAATGQAAVLTFVLALNNFAVPALLQTKVFPAEVWVRFNTTFDYAAAIKMSLPLVIAPLLLLMCIRPPEIGWPRIEGGVAAHAVRRQLGAGWFWGCGCGAVLVAFFALGLPLMKLIMVPRTWFEIVPALEAGQRAMVNSIFYAAVAATLCVVLSLIGWRWPVGVVVWLPFLIPGVLLGIVLIYAMNRPWLSRFYQSAGIVLMALAIRYLAVGWSLVTRAMKMADSDLIDAANLNGATRWQLFRWVHWPQIYPQLGASWYLTYLLCLWDVETLVLIVPPGGETLALRIFNLLHYGHNAHVNALCLALLLLAILPLLMWLLIRALATFPWRDAGRLIERKGSLWSAIVMVVLAGGCSPELASNVFPVPSVLFDRVQVIGTRGTGLGQFNKPRSLAVDRQDNLYVADMTGRVQKFSPEGNFITHWQMPQTDKGKPKGMDVDQAGNIVVIEPHYSRVSHFAANHQVMAQWGTAGTNAGQLSFPRAVAVNSKGELCISEYGIVERIQIFAALGGPFLRSLGRGGGGPGELSRAEGLGVDHQDRIYVADSCNHRIQIFSRDGQWLRAHGKPGSGPGQMSYPYDVRVDRQGRQYVCEFGNSRIQVFDAQDRFLEMVGEAGGDPGQFNNPWSIALDANGNLYVADAANHRVQKFFVRPKSKVQGPRSASRAKAKSVGKLAQKGMTASLQNHPANWEGRSRTRWHRLWTLDFGLWTFPS